MINKITLFLNLNKLLIQFKNSGTLFIKIKVLVTVPVLNILKVLVPQPVLLDLVPAPVRERK